MGEQEEAVRRDPEVQQAWKIAEVARVHLGLLTQAQADRRATERHTPPDGRTARPGTTQRRPLGPGLALVPEHPALAALLSLVAAAAAWLAARTLARHRKRSRQ
jgi:hypothetical protein